MDNFGSRYLRGLAFLGKRDGVRAAAEFQTIIDHRGVSPCNPMWALAYLGLARPRVLAGDVASARSAYEQFFTIWKGADTSLPLLKQAREEWGRLPTTIGASASTAVLSVPLSTPTVVIHDEHDFIPEATADHITQAIATRR